MRIGVQKRSVATGRTGCFSNKSAVEEADIFVSFRKIHNSTIACTRSLDGALLKDKVAGVYKA